MHLLFFSFLVVCRLFLPTAALGQSNESTIHASMASSDVDRASSSFVEMPDNPWIRASSGLSLIEHSPLITRTYHSGAGPSFWKHTLIGAGVGALVGVALTGAMIASNPDDSLGLTMVIVPLVGIGVGTIAGVLVYGLKRADGEPSPRTQ